MEPKIVAVERRQVSQNAFNGKSADPVVRDDAGNVIPLSQRFDPNERSIVASRQAAADPTQTAEFKAWFGDSKVVDQTGKPLVVLHGTTSGRIDAFRQPADSTHPRGLGIWFAAPSADPDYDVGNEHFIADVFAGAGTDEGTDSFDSYPAGAAHYPSFLAVRNPYEALGYEDLLDEMEGKTAGQFRAELMARGHDGIVVRSCATDGGCFRDDWVVFSPAQIRSVYSFRQAAADPIAAAIHAAGFPDEDEWEEGGCWAFAQGLAQYIERDLGWPATFAYLAGDDGHGQAVIAHVAVQANGRAYDHLGAHTDALDAFSMFIGLAPNPETMEVETGATAAEIARVCRIYGCQFDSAATPAAVRDRLRAARRSNHAVLSNRGRREADRLMAPPARPRIRLGVSDGAAEDTASAVQPTKPTKHPAKQPAHHYHWRTEEEYDVRRFIHGGDTRESLRRWFAQYADESMLDALLTKPVVCVELDGKAHLWSGREIVAAALEMDVSTVQAVVGVPKPPGDVIVRAPGVRLLPAAQWPRTVSQHVEARVRERSLNDWHVVQLYEWGNSRPFVPAGVEWHKWFWSVLMVGFHNRPNSVLKRGMIPRAGSLDVDRWQPARAAQAASLLCLTARENPATIATMKLNKRLAAARAATPAARRAHFDELVAATRAVRAAKTPAQKRAASARFDAAFRA